MLGFGPISEAPISALPVEIVVSKPKPLVMLWWNTSLSPLGKSRGSSADKAYVATYLTELRQNLNVDIMALGEVCTEDINNIIATIGDPHLSFRDATHPVGGCKFDIAILFDRRRLSLANAESIVDSYGKNTLKIGERLNFNLCDSDKNLHLFVSHWPGRQHCEEPDPRRMEIGTSLRKRLDTIRTTSQQYIVLMGDYNDDPCSPSLSKHLLATRDRELARSDDAFLYNPFWRMLGESAPFVHGQATTSICGTHYYSSGTHTRWVTFDQIMFSSAFLNDGPLLLNEEKSMIIRCTDLELRLRSSKENFDHLPVLGVIDIKEDV
jgi:hypothetical protein